MTSYSEQECAGIVAAYDFSGAAVVDVGGGQ
jgi:hypothetical protein